MNKVICPCCGFKFAGAMTTGCEQCGARAVGEPLPRPANELPSYGRSLVLSVAGSLTVLVFVTQTIIALFQRGFRSFGFWTVVAAGETASWRLRWISIPVMFVVLWAGLKLYRSIKDQPERFCGLKYARRGLVASATVGLLIATLIGITVPARLRQRDDAASAAVAARGYTIALLYARYFKAFKTLPDQATAREDFAKLPDPDGWVSAALKDYDSAGYQPRAEIAAVSGPKRRRVAIRNAAYNPDDDTTPTGLAFTNYEHRLPGDDKILGTEDDWIVRDGVVSRVADLPGEKNRPATTGVIKP